MIFRRIAWTVSMIFGLFTLFLFLGIGGYILSPSPHETLWPAFFSGDLTSGQTTLGVSLVVIGFLLFATFMSIVTDFLLPNYNKLLRKS